MTTDDITGKRDSVNVLLRRVYLLPFRNIGTVKNRREEKETPL
jgi:hypothetical protein